MKAAASDQGKGSVTVTVELPADVAQRYGAKPEKIGRHLLEQAAVEGYRSREISRGQVARMLQMDWEETEAFLAKHRCDRHYELEDLEQDRRNLDKIFGPT